jgi:hypothetical protein
MAAPLYAFHKPEGSGVSITRIELQTYLTPAELAKWERLVEFAERNPEAAFHLERSLRRTAIERRDTVGAA